MSDLTVTSFVSTGTTARSIDFSTGNIIVANNAGGTLINMTATGLTATGESTGNGFIVQNNSANATTLTFGAFTEPNAMNLSIDRGTYALTLASSGAYRNLNFTGFAGSLTNVASSIYGNLILSTGMTLVAGTAAWTLAATTDNWTVTTNGKTLDFPLTFGTATSALATWILQDALTLGTTRLLTLTGGNLNINDKTVTTGLFASNNSNTRNINFGNGKIVLNASTAVTVWTTATTTGLTVSGVPLVESRGGGTAITKTITPGSLNEANAINFSLLETTGSVTYVITAGAVKNLTINGAQTLSNTALSIYGHIIHGTGNGTTTFATGTNAWTLANTGTTTGNNYGAFFPSGGYLTVPANSNYVFDGDFTIEGWMYFTNVGFVDPQSLFCIGNVSAGFDVRWFNSRWQISFNAGAGTDMGGTATNNTWIHVAAVRSGSSVKLYINGVATGTTITNSSTLGYSNVALGIGAGGVTAGNPLQNGYISNLRIVKGIAVYTNNFTPPSGPLTATQSAGTNIAAIPGTETVLLTCQSSTFVDNSSYGVTPTQVSNAAVSALSPFTLYSTSTKAVGLRATVDFPITVNGVGGEWELDNNLTLGATRVFTLTNGTFDFNNRTITASGITVLTGSATARNLITTLAVTHTSGSLTLGSNISTGAYTLTAGNLFLGTNTLTMLSFASNNSNIRNIDFATGKIVLSNSATATIWTTATVTNLTTSGSRLIESTGGGTSVLKTINPGSLSEANALNFSLLNVGGTVTYSFNSGSVNNLLINGQQTFDNTATLTIYGNYTHSISNGTTTFTARPSAWVFASTTGIKTITTASATHEFPWTFNGVGGTWLLQSSVTLGINGTLTLTNGNVDLNGYTLTSGLFATAAGTKSLIFNGGTLAITGSGATTFNNANTSQLILDKGSSVGTISLTSAIAKTFIGGNFDYSGVILNQGGTGTLTVAGSNTFEDLSATISTTANSTITFSSGTTTTWKKFTLNGTATYQPTVASDTVDSPATFYKEPEPSGFITGINYIRAQDITFTPFATDGTDFIRWHIGANSVIVSSTGALAQTYLAGSTPKVYVIETGSSWKVPNDFNTTNNSIHLFGGGGGGGSSVSAITARIGRSAGAGGGGGYTRVTNFNPKNLISVDYTVGAGGQGSTIYSSPGGNGGSTVFSTFSAGGGSGGAAMATSLSGGAGGTGSTANGGAGGNGTDGGLSTYTGGGGGGGAGGVYGNGASGAIGGSTNSDSVAGGGGGGGAASGGTAGSAGSGVSGGSGGNNSFGIGGSVFSTTVFSRAFAGGGGAGSYGGVYLGASPRPATAGGHGTDILNSVGAGGGGGGQNQRAAGGTGGKYGGGGAGGARSGSSGLNGATGGIIIQYLPVTPKFLGWFN